MPTILRTLVLAVFAAGALVAGASLAAEPVKPLVFQTEEGVAILGYDPVAYFTEGAPTKGDPAYTAEYDGATWYFANAANRDRFLAEPKTYAPAYGGWCAYGMAQGGKVPIDPAAWKIVDGTLYLNVNRKVQGWWQADIPGFIAKADANWAGLTHQ